MRTKSSRPVPVASRVNRFSYAIRNIVAEAKAVEASGKHVRYLNIGDPVAFGFQTPAHVIDAATRAKLDALRSPDGSTAHFDFGTFMSRDGRGFSGGNVATAQVKENVRRLMYKLEALRVKAGNRPVQVNSGFRSVAGGETYGVVRY